jgi:predicted nucleic acid-binding protein
MNANFFLDTNLFDYCFDGKPFRKACRASQLIREAITTRKGLLNYQVVQEFFSVALCRFEQPRRPEKAEQYLANVFRPLRVVHSSQALYNEALQVVRQYRIAWYDVLILAGALQAQCGALFSEDFQRGQHLGELRIQNSFL